MSEAARVVPCWLPGGFLCTLALDGDSGAAVRAALAAELGVLAEVLRPFSILLRGQSRWAIELWDETCPLPSALAQPPTVGCRCGLARRRAEGSASRVTSLHLRRLGAAAGASSSPAASASASADGASPDAAHAQALLGMLDGEQALEDLRCGNVLLGDDDEAVDVAALALLLAAGSHDPAVHTPKLLRSALGGLVPSLSRALASRHADVLRRHAELQSGSVGSARGARLALASTLSRALPLLDAGEGAIDVLRECQLFGGVWAGRRSHVLAVGAPGVFLARERGGGGGGSSAPLSACRLGWASLRGWRMARGALYLIVAPPAAAALRRLGAGAAIGASRGDGGDVLTLRFRAAQAALISCVLQAGAPAPLSEPGDRV